MTQPGGRTRGGSEQVVVFVRGLIESGALHAGDRLPTEREMAVRLGVSRPTVRSGLRALASLGILRSRRGSGTFITEGHPALGGEPLSFLAALQGFTQAELYEVRRIFEVGAAGLAAERATPCQVATLADEVTGMFESLDDPATFLAHDMRFHRTIGLASGNQIVASLTELVSGLYYDYRRESAPLATPQNMREAADSHRRIYQAIRARNAHLAREAMNGHLLAAQAFHAAEAPLGPADRTPVMIGVAKDIDLAHSLRGNGRGRRANQDVPF